MSKLLSTALFLVFAINLSGQTRIEFRNPSFEDIPRAGKMGSPGPIGWEDCSAPFQTTVDIQPGFFGVSKKSQHGSSYVGLITREDETNEFISQRLSKKLDKDSTYIFSIYLAKSDYYISKIKGSRYEFNFDHSTKLKVWGGDTPCSKQELFFQSEIIDHEKWIKYEINFKSKEAWSYLTFECYYTGGDFPTNGNLLMDAINIDDKDLVSSKNKTSRDEHDRIIEFEEYRYSPSATVKRYLLQQEKLSSEIQEKTSIKSTNTIPDEKKRTILSVQKKRTTLPDSTTLTGLPAYRLIDWIGTNITENKDCRTHVSNVKELHNLKVNGWDLEKFIRKLAPAEIQSMKLTLKKVEATAIHRLFERLEVIINREVPIFPEDKEFLSNCQSKYDETQQQKTMDIYMTQFVRKNRKAIIDELLSCK